MIASYRLQLIKESSVNYPDEPIRTADSVANLAWDYLNLTDREHFICIALNTRNKVIGVNTVAIGSVDAAIVHPREVYKFALLANATSVIFAHNHPSGTTEESAEDVVLTKRLIEVGKIMGIHVLDHIIVGDKPDFLSMNHKGLCNFDSTNN